MGNGFGKAIVTIGGGFGGTFYFVKTLDGAGGLISDVGGCNSSDCGGLDVSPDALGGTYTAWESFSSRAVHLDHTSDQIIGSVPFNFNYPGLASDGSGGAYIAWPCEVDHYAANGNQESSAPLPNCAYQTSFKAASDAAGGAFIEWRQGANISLLRVTTTGDPAAGWNPNGVIVGQTSGFGDPSIIPDGLGGLLLSWENASNQLMAQHVTAQGAVAAGWPAPGRQVGPDSLAYGPSSIVPDGNGGMFIGWVYTVDNHPHGQHLLNDGTVAPGWLATGRLLSEAAGTQAEVAATTDGAGGVIFAWTNGSDHRIYAQHLVASEAPPIPLAVPPPTASNALSIQAWNPVTGPRWQCALDLPWRGAAHVSLFDPAGRLVSIEDLGATAAGHQVVSGDASLLHPGVYLARVEQGGRTATTKLVVAR